MANVIVIGDKCTDKYVFGETTRLSPEQPVPVLDQTRICLLYTSDAADEV